MAVLTNEQARLLLEPNFATVGTVNPDGSPQLTIVWIDWDGEHVLFNTAAGRVKARNLERDLRVSVLVADRADGYRWVGVRGAAELTSEGADEHIDKLARKYTGEGWRPKPDERRLLVRVRPERVSAYGLS
ncbi:MAG: PPOX class F420-dependent oxidoreductase [Actinobacteria bacterium]|nr:MAG: PPOX class F420-dependent oxidoreductase [Actinomycetota bacterium]TMM35390.1 MAG: PPOX class F420-dependent oxidoreductase [Actinomycetota bacterium]